MLSWGRPFLLFSLALVLVAPGGESQTPPFSEPSVNLEVPPIPGHLMPETQRGESVITARVGCNEGDQAGGPTTVTFEVLNPFPDTVSVTLSSTTVSQAFSAQECLVPTFHKNFTTAASIVLTRQAPAFHPHELIVRATVVKPHVAGATQTFGPYAAPLAFSPDYVPIMEYLPARYHQKTGANHEAVYAVRATNFGNGATVVTTTVETSGSRSLDGLSAPAPTTLESRAELGDRAQYWKEIVISVRSPSSNGVYTFDATFQAASLHPSASPTDEQQITFSLQVTGASSPIGSGLGTLVAGALATAAMRRGPHKT